MQGRIHRRRRGRWIAGVCAGVADWLDLPVWLVRLVWLVVAILPVLPGLPAYLVLWIVVPLAEAGVEAPAGQSVGPVPQ